MGILGVRSSLVITWHGYYSKEELYGEHKDESHKLARTRGFQGEFPFKTGTSKHSVDCSDANLIALPTPRDTVKLALLIDSFQTCSGLPLLWPQLARGCCQQTNFLNKFN